MRTGNVTSPSRCSYSTVSASPDLAVLTVERRLPRGAPPRFEEGVQDAGPHTGMGGVVQMTGHHRLMRVVGKLIEDLALLENELEQSSLPSAAAHRVEQGQIGEVRPFQQQRPQRDRTTDVVGDDAGPRQAPVAQKRLEVHGVRRQAEVLALALLRLSETEMVEDEDLAVQRERRRDVPPQEGRIRGAVHQHDRVAFAQHRPPHDPVGCGELFVQRPIHGRLPFDRIRRSS